MIIFEFPEIHNLRFNTLSKMRIINKNSKNRIKVGVTEIGSYLEINKPIVLDWSDCDGSMGRYCTLMGLKDAEFISLTHELNFHIYKDYSENPEGLLIDFQPLLSLLENGLYFINYSKGSENPVMESYLVFPKRAVTEQTFINENKDDVLLFTSHWYYELQGSFTIATQSEDSINREQVEFYKNEIIQGKRPFVIGIYKSYITDELKTNETRDDNPELTSAVFLLDGHHKFLAYQELKISPPTFTICQGFSNSDAIYFDLGKLKNYLNHFQTDHLEANR